MMRRPIPQNVACATDCHRLESPGMPPRVVEAPLAAGDPVQGPLLVAGTQRRVSCRHEAHTLGLSRVV